MKNSFKSSRNRPSFLTLAAAIAGLSTSLFPSIALATDRTWDGFSSNSFTLNSNWTANVAPVSADNTVFRNQAGVTRSLVVIDANRTVAGMSIDGTPSVGAYEFQKTGTNLLTVAGFIVIGNNGLGATPVTFNGLNVSSGTLQASSGTLTLTGGAQVTASGAFVTGSGAVVNIGSATVNTPSMFALGTNSTINVNAGASVTAGAFGINDPSARFNVNNGGVLNVSSSALQSGTLTLNSGGTINLTGGAIDTNGAAFIQFNRNYTLPAGRSMYIDGGGKLSSTSYVDIGSAGNGTLLVDGSTSSFLAGTNSADFYSDWGNNGFTADVTISNSATARYMRGLHIGTASAGSVGRLKLNSAGVLTVDTVLATGGLGSADVTINGATLVSNDAANFDNHTTIALQTGGAINFNGDGTFLTGSTLNWTGGFVAVAAGKSLNVSGGVIDNTAGGQALGNGGTIRVLNGGQFNNSSYFDVGNNAATGTLLVDGANSKFTANTSSSDWGRLPGNNATVTFSNAGAGTYSNIRMSNNGGSATLNLQTNGVLNVGGFQAGFSTATSPLSRINISGGTLTTTGVNNFMSGATVALSSGGLILGGASTFTTGATLNQTGGTLVLPANKTLAFDGGVGTISPTLYGGGTTLRVSNGGKLAVNGFLYGGQPGAGTLIVDGSNSSFSIIGGYGNSTLGNGSTASADVTVSNGAIADFTGNPDGVYLASSGSPTRLNVLSGGNFSAVGLRNEYSPGVATVTVNGGGIVTTGASTFAGVGSTVNLQNGSIAFGDATFSTGTTFNWSGGTMSVASGKSLTFDGGVGSVTTVAGRGLSDGATLNVLNGGLVTATNYFDIGNSSSGSSGPTGALLVQGVGSRFIQSAGGFSIWSNNAGDSASITFASGGVGTLSGGLGLGYSGGNATLQVLSGASLYVGSILDVGSFGSSNTTLINVSSATLTVDADAVFDHNVELDYNSGSVVFTKMLTLSRNSKVFVTAGGSKVLRVGGLSMSGTSDVELNDNDMIVGSLSSKSVVEGYVRTGRANGAWNGTPGITSITAKNNSLHNTGLGVISGGQYSTAGGSGTFDGVNYGPADTLVKYTYNGDADLNGKINADDYGHIDSGYQNQHNGGFVFDWFHGDFDYNGIINADDYALIDSAYQLQSGTLRAAIDYLETGALPSDAAASGSLGEVIQHNEQFGAAYANSFIFTNVPEPMSAIAVVAAGSLMSVRRRRPLLRYAT